MKNAAHPGLNTTATDRVPARLCSSCAGIDASGGPRPIALARAV